jgi:hypothetical protein
MKNTSSRTLSPYSRHFHAADGGNRMKKITTLFFLSLCLLGLLSVNAYSDDIPKRKPGLWEIKGQIEGMPNMGAVQECVDKDTDNILQQSAQQEGVECMPPVVKRSGDKITIHTECKIDEEMSTSTDYNLQGSFDSAYQGTAISQITSSGDTRKTTFTINARWIGPCKPGQKPGDGINQ